jgi:hypothetical protein
MELTDREKLLIATLCIRKQAVYVMGDFKRTELVKEFSKSLNVQNAEELFFQMKFEEDQLKGMLKDIEIGNECNFFGDYSSLNNQEKFIFYSVSLMLVKDLPYEMNISLTQMLKVLLGIEKDRELLEKVLKQFNDSLDFIEYMETKV